MVAPSGEGSLGDEAILQSCAESIKEQNRYDSVDLAHFQTPREWAHLDCFDRRILVHQLLDCNWLRAAWRCSGILREYSALYMPGTDVLDGYYSERRSVNRLRLAAMAARSGMTVSVMGFSVNASPSALCMKTIQNLPAEVRISCRDTLSRTRLEQATGRSVMLTADLAFLLRPRHGSPISRQLAAWCDSERKMGRIVVGLNVNEHLRMPDSKSFDDLVTALRDALRTVDGSVSHGASGISIVCIPHDRREAHDDWRVLERVRSSLGEALGAHAVLLPRSVRADEIKAVTGSLDLMISGRMHVAIACLGSGTPVACVAYQGKFEGLFEHFGLTECIITPETITDSARLSRFLTEFVNRRYHLREQIQERRPSVEMLAARNVAMERS